MGRKLRNLRGDRSRASVAREIGCSYQLMWLYETGRRIPSDMFKERIAAYYGIPVGFLFYGEGKRKANTEGAINGKRKAVGSCD